MKTLVGVVVLMGAVGAIYAANRMTRTEDGKSRLHVAAELPINVQASSPLKRDIVRTVQAPGDVEAFLEVDISAEVVGKIIEMAVEEGQKVSKDDLLCRLDDADYKARVASAEAIVARLAAAIVQTDADLEKAQRDYDRQTKLSEADATSALEVADYKTVLTRTKAGLEMRRQELIEAEHRLRSAREDLLKTVLRAPIDGIVSQRFAKQGEVVITGTMNNPGTRIMVISDMSKMQVRCRVDEGDAPLVKPDQSARIFLQADTQRGIVGRVLRVGSKGTKPQGRDVVTFETLVLVDRIEDRIKPGMASNVEIEVARSPEALTVPIEAVVHRRRKDLPAEMLEQLQVAAEEVGAAATRRSAEYLKIVFTIEGEVAKPKLVETGINDETTVEVLKGLELENRIAVGPYRSLDQLKDGSKLKIEEPAKKKEDKDPAKDSAETGEAQASAGKAE